MKPSPLRLLLGACLLLPALAAFSAEPQSPAVTPFPQAQIRSVWVQKIWGDGGHNGFPGIARVGDFYYVTFRHSDSHQATAAKIVVIRARVQDLEKWEPVAEFTREHDCRDPLVFDNHGKVQVVFHSQEDYYSQSADGVTWSDPALLQTEFAQPREGSGLVFTSQRRWLFRIRRGPDGAFYSLGRCGIKEKGGGSFGLILYRSEDGVNFKALHTYGEGPTSGLNAAGGTGWGHEADIAWTPAGEMVAAIRNGRPGVVVFGRDPRGPWPGFASDAWNFGGPALHTTRNGGILLAARALPAEKTLGFPAVCKVWTVTAEGLQSPWVIPSGGDCAYQSFVDGPTGEEVFLVYYSSHEHPQPKGVGNNPADIYLAHLRVK